MRDEERSDHERKALLRFTVIAPLLAAPPPDGELQEELSKLAQQFGVIYSRSPAQENEANYTIDHSSTVILIDPNARLHAIFTPPHTPEAMVSDFAKIREHYRLKNH